MDTRTSLLLASLLLLPGTALAGRRPAAPPEGFVEVTVEAVVPTVDGGTVLLADADRKVVVPVSVGSTELLTIALRFERRRYGRPLTHDLLDSVLDRMGGEVREVRIDDLRTGIFVAHIAFREGRNAFSLDARASDAIAMALGHDLPIWMAAPILEQAGLPYTEPLLPSVPDPTAPSL